MGEYTNSQQVRFDRSHISCGVVEVHHLPKGERQTCFAMANYLYHKANPRPAAFMIFSDIIGSSRDNLSRGQLLAEYIVSLKVGTLESSAPQVNPRTGNRITAWVFTPDHEKFRAWYTEETMNRIDER